MTYSSFRLKLKILSFLILSMLFAGTVWANTTDIVRNDSVTKPPAPKFEIRLLKQFFIPDSFRAATWDEKQINIYNEDVTRMRDTFSIPINDAVKNIHFTFPIKGRVTSGFGSRRAYGFIYHFGTDLKLNTGDTVVSALPGIVRVVRYDRGYGNFIIVAHTNGLETLYGHLSATLVKPGQEVASGDQIGLGGSTGYSTGSHLHFEFRFLGVQFDAQRVLDFTTDDVLTDTLNINADWFHYLAEMRAARYHVIRSGDFLGRIAKIYGTSIGAICRLNGITVKTLLRPGRKLRVH